MKLAYITVKGKLTFNVAAMIKHNGHTYYAVDAAGFYFLALPESVTEIPHSGTIYEDEHIKIYT